MTKKPLIILTGPTAVGKTNLSIQIAKRLHGEIISADSMQVYRHMDIGSAKATPLEMDGVPHHLINVLEPWDCFHVARFQEMAKSALRCVYERDRMPVVVGGTGFYIQALLYDVSFTPKAGGGSLRKKLEEMMEQEGQEVMHQRLAQVDPISAGEIHPNNKKRVIRALEYYEQTHTPISQHNQEERKKESPYEFYYYVLTMERERLYQRIDNRVDQMLEAGLVDEVKALKAMGCTRNMMSMQGLGYKEIISFLDGEISLEEAVRILKRDTRHFAKRQLTWFRRERQVRWLNLEEFDFDTRQVLDYILKQVRANPVMDEYLNRKLKEFTI